MFPLKVNYIGHSSQCLSDLQYSLDLHRIKLSNTYVDFASAHKGLQHVANKSRQLFIVEYSDKEHLKVLEQLTTAFDGWPILVVAPSDIPSHDLLQITRSGASQIVTFPLNTDDLHKVLQLLARQFSLQIHSSKLIAISSVVGGGGATSLAINICAEIVENYQVPVILIELARQIGQVAAYLNIEPEFNTKDVFKNPERMDDTLIKQVLVNVDGNNLWNVLTGPSHIQSPIIMNPKDVVRLLTIAGELAQIIVIDLPCTYDDVFMHVLSRADQFVIVGQQILPALRVMKMLVNQLNDDRIKREHYYVMNRFNSKIGGYSIDRLTEAIGVDQLVAIPDEPATFAQAANLGVPLRKISANSEALAQINRLTAKLVNQKPVQTEAAKVSTWTKLTKRFQRS